MTEAQENLERALEILLRWQRKCEAEDRRSFAEKLLEEVE